MSDWDRWVNLEGPPPEAIQKLYAAIRAEDLERRIMEAIDAQETGATREADMPLDFDAWAKLSASLLGAGDEERREALAARGLSPEAFRRCDEHYERSLAKDRAQERVVRVTRYARLCAEAEARRKTLPRPSAEEAPARPPAATPAPAHELPTVILQEPAGRGPTTETPARERPAKNEAMRGRDRHARPRWRDRTGAAALGVAWAACLTLLPCYPTLLVYQHVKGSGGNAAQPTFGPDYTYEAAGASAAGLALLVALLLRRRAKAGG